MADVTLIDPLGRSITLHDHTWFGHIIKGHPEMKTRRPDVEKAIQSPDQICYSNSAVECRLYFAPDRSAVMFIAVVADVVQGLVKTAYLAKAPKGLVEW